MCLLPACEWCNGTAACAEWTRCPLWEEAYRCGSRAATTTGGCSKNEYDHIRIKFKRFLLNDVISETVVSFKTCTAVRLPHEMTATRKFQTEEPPPLTDHLESEQLLTLLVVQDRGCVSLSFSDCWLKWGACKHHLPTAQPTHSPSVNSQCQLSCFSSVLSRCLEVTLPLPGSVRPRICVRHRRQRRGP